MHKISKDQLLILFQKVIIISFFIYFLNKFKNSHHKLYDPHCYCEYFMHLWIKQEYLFKYYQLFDKENLKSSSSSKKKDLTMAGNGLIFLIAKMLKTNKKKHLHTNLLENQPKKFTLRTMNGWKDYEKYSASVVKQIKIRYQVSTGFLNFLIPTVVKDLVNSYPLLVGM